MSNVTSINDRLKHSGKDELSLADIWHGVLFAQRENNYKLGWAGFVYEDITGRDPRKDYTEHWGSYEPVFNPAVSELVAKRQADMREKNRVALSPKLVDGIRGVAGLTPSSSHAKHGKAANALLEAVVAFAENNKQFDSLDHLCDFLSKATVARGES